MFTLVFGPVFFGLIVTGLFIPDKYMDPIIKRLGGSTDDSL